MKRTVLGGLVLLAAASAACQDIIFKTLGTENAVSVENTPGTLRFQASNLDNVHDEVDIDWENPEGRAAIAHRSFVPHGQVVVTVSDAAGVLLYSTPAEYQLDNQTQAGQPGTWHVRFQFFGARGRVDVSLTALAGEGDPELVPPLPPQPSP
ncbi:MAG: hypothetical protein ACJ8AT_20940 [Hyalangium sp.]|uniref:hypothetical protein n=1 Tax=Hyalangium sp. TaxID=2028555 RepID=UPI00389A0274